MSADIIDFTSYREARQLAANVAKRQADLASIAVTILYESSLGWLKEFSNSFNYVSPEEPA